ncbi:MAG: amidohydrolase [Chitinophagaceae bacterium]
MKRFLLSIGFFLTIHTCFAQKKTADLIVYNAKVYTVNTRFDITQAFAVRDGKFLEVGPSYKILQNYTSSKMIDAAGKAIYPGFIDAHAHFVGYAQNLQSANLVGTESWDAVLQTMKTFADKHLDGWLLGSGWDQNDWPSQQFPTKEQLDRLFPNRPVVLERIDGHAVIANQKALDIAGVDGREKVSGGMIVLEKGKPTGVLVDNAMDLVRSKIPNPTSNQMVELLDQAQKNCFALGLTTVDDCGLDFEVALQLDSLQKAGLLKMRMYVLLSDAQKNFDFLFRRGIVKTDRMDIRGFKVYADGALGSRGACLLQPYSDAPTQTGFLLNSIEHYKKIAETLANYPFQMCTHAIGDSANRVLLDVYASVLKGKNDRRWRIEHAQVVSKTDIEKFGKYSIIPSVQPTHATSDMYWAGERLGKERIKTAYAYQDLLQQNGWLPLGTDFPVEHINPMFTFYAAVARQDQKGFPKDGFQKENALTREQALRGMTIWAAKANFEEREKGSIQKDKLADFVILDNDLMTAPSTELYKIKPIATYLGGEKVYSGD